MFSLSNTDSTFKSRQASVFDSLGDLEKKSQEKQEEDENKNADFRKPRTPSPPSRLPSRSGERRSLRGSDYRHSRSGRHSRHDDRRHRGSRDTKRDSSKWVEYDLSDVSSDQLSNQANSAAAFSFLADIRKSREEQHSAPENVEDLGKVTFNKPKTANKASSATAKSDDDAAAPSFVSGKRRMPEYIVGGGSKKEKMVKKDKSRVAKCSAVSLSHLGDEDDEEEDDD